MGTKNEPRDPTPHGPGDVPKPRRKSAESRGEQISKAEQLHIEQRAEKLLQGNAEAAEARKYLAEIAAEMRTVRSSIRKKLNRQKKLHAELGELSESLYELHQKEKFLWGWQAEEHGRLRSLKAAAVEQVRHGREQSNPKA